MDMKVQYFVFGIVALLVAKYVIFGLDAWNNMLHPGRIEPDSLNQFRKPLLGLLEQKTS